MITQTKKEHLSYIDACKALGILLLFSDIRMAFPMSFTI